MAYQALTTNYLDHTSNRVKLTKSSLGYDVYVDGAMLGRVLKLHPALRQTAIEKACPWYLVYRNAATGMLDGSFRAVFSTRKDTIDELLFVTRHQYDGGTVTVTHSQPKETA